MATRPKPLPDFASEEEEIRFWDEHDPSDYVEGPADVIIRLKKHKKRAVTMRLDEPLYQQLRTVAARHGLPYQRLMRGLLRQSLTALLAEERRLADG
jgi:predicted DNA binding CopG/RHH family protein